MPGDKTGGIKEVDHTVSLCDGLCTMPEQFTEEEIADKIQETMNHHAPVHQDRIRAYAKIRHQADLEDWGPRDQRFQDMCNESQTIQTMFMLDRVRTRVWVKIWYMDFFYYALQQHPLLGFFEKGPHPMTIEDRILVIVGGITAAMLNSATAQCDREFCVLPGGDIPLHCHESFLENGVCDDGSNVTHLGIDAGYPCDYGHDCFDCGPVNQEDYQLVTFQYWGSDNGIRCFKPGFEHLVWNLAWAIFCAMVMVSVKQLIMCKCFIWSTNQSMKELMTDVGQTLGVLIVVIMSMFAGSVVGHSRDFSFLALLKCKVMAYCFSIFGIALAFIHSAARERAKIHQFRGSIENFVLATTRLYPDRPVDPSIYTDHGKQLAKEPDSAATPDV